MKLLSTSHIAINSFKLLTVGNKRLAVLFCVVKEWHRTINFITEMTKSKNPSATSDSVSD